MPERNNLIAYALDFTSYLLTKTTNVERIILHGSVARGDFDEKSDVDIFIDIKNNKIKNNIQKLFDNYQKTKRYKEWELKGINNPLSIIAGSLDSKEWKNLKRAILSTGVLLYGKYKSNVEKINQYTIFSFENIKPNKKRISIFRKLFGFRIGKKIYPGLIEKINAIRINKGCFLVPAEYVIELKRYFQEKKVPVKLYDCWSDTKIEN